VSIRNVRVMEHKYDAPFKEDVWRKLSTARFQGSAAVHSSGMLRIVGCYRITYVAGWPIGPVMKGQAVQEECVISQKNTDL